MILVADTVNEQYEQWVYPEPIHDLEAYYARGIAEEAEPRMVHWHYWPDGFYALQKQENIDILVAGCGSNQAAKLAYTHPKARVVGIDMCSASLAHEQKLKEKHTLNNLTLHNLDLHDVASLRDTKDGKFDLIISSGVLHHLPDPLTGLKALKTVLRPKTGVLFAMVYGLYGRMGLYGLQQAFQLLGLGQTPNDVALVRSVLAGLPAHHPVQPMLKNNLDMNYDAGIVDMFLHPMDHGFSVQDCLNWVNNAGLEFQGWLDPFAYEPAAWVKDPAVRAKLMALPKPQQWQTMELLNGGIRMHSFMACHPDRPKSSYQLNFNSPKFLTWIPIKRVHRFVPANGETHLPAWIQRDPHPPVPLTPPQAALFGAINNSNTVQQCIGALKPFTDVTDPTAFARSVLASLWEIGLVLFYCPS
ncbi:MAG: class I SAM-dependent methyltransferase [Vampirovibrionales bacterium]|nr:class I SAM-dependent methyltransferase [Vampirovibrionales bacterium]